ncbi:MAG TPA: hypothetical protein VHZ03_44430 [Trebonia sp.]|nr:hypothetical protein [Trebonia sp.]
MAGAAAGVSGVAACLDQPQYAAHVRGYLGPYLGGIPLAELSPADVQAMFAAIIRSDVALGRPADARPLAAAAA